MRKFKLTLKKTFRDRKFVTTLMSIVFFLFMFVMSGIFVFSSLNKSEKLNSQNLVDNNLYMNYRSRSENDQAMDFGFNPLAIFSSENVTVDNENISSLSLRNGYIFNFDSSEVIKDVEAKIKDENYYIDIFKYLPAKTIEKHKTFIKMWEKTKNYKKYGWYINSFVEYWNKNPSADWKTENLADSITDKLFDRVFCDPNKTGKATVDGYNASKPIEFKVKTSDDSYGKSNLEDAFFNNQDQRIDHLGIKVSKTIDDGNPFDFYFLTFDEDSSVSLATKTIKETSLIYTDKDLYNTSTTDSNSTTPSWFIEDSNEYNKKYNNIDLFGAYVEDVARQNKFNFSYLNQYIYSNFMSNDKFMLVDKTENIINGKNLNSVNLKYTKKSDRINLNFKNTIVLSNRYASRNGKEIGDEIRFNGDVEFKFEIGALGYEYSKIYPLIFDTDYFPNTKDEAVMYVNKSVLVDKKLLTYNFLSDESKLLFNYYGKEYKSDLNNLEKALKLNPTQTNHKTDLTKDNSKFNNLKVSAIDYLKAGFLYIFLTILGVTSIVTISSITVLVKRDINNKMTQHAILKASGQTNNEIASEYGLQVLYPGLIGAVVSYPFVLVLEKLLLLIIQPYFEINFSITLGALYFCVGLMIFSLISFGIAYIISFSQLKHKNILDMMNKTEVKKITPSMRFVDRLKINNFSKRFAMKQYAVSWKKVLILSAVTFVSSFSLTTLMTIPTQIKQVKNNYYKQYNYTEASQYQEVNVNNPFDSYQVYSDPIETSTFFPDAFKWKNLFTTMDNYVMGDDDDGDIIQDEFVFTLLYLKNKHFSIGAFQNVIDKFAAQVNKETFTKVLTNVLTTIIPKVFGVSIDNVKNWQDAISKMVAKKMPAELLQYWNDKEIRQKFSFDFMTTNFNKDEDTLTTNLYGDKENLVGYSDSNLINSDTSDLKENEVYVTKKYSLNNNVKIGDNINFNYLLPVLGYWSDKKEDYEEISPDQFVYVNDVNNINANNEVLASETDLSHYTYVNEEYENGSDNSIGTGTPYYLVGNGSCPTGTDDNYESENGKCYRKYYKAQNIFLKLDAEAIDPKEWVGEYTNGTTKEGQDESKVSLFNEGEGSVIKKVNEGQKTYYYIPLYDFRYQTNYIHNYQSIVLYGGTVPYSFYDEATKVTSVVKSGGEDVDKTFLSVFNKSNSVKLKVKDILKIYDKNDLYTSRENANKLIKYNNGQSASSSYFNGLMSKNELQKDVLLHIAFSKLNGNLSLNTMSDLVNQNKVTDMMLNKLNVLNDIYVLLVELSVVFIVIVIVISVIIVSMVSSQFIQQFAKMIFTLKILGYNNKEIHKILLRILLPLTLTFGIIGSLLPGILFIFAELSLISFGFIIPLVFPWYMFVISFVIISNVFALSYMKNYGSVIASTQQKNMLF